MKNYLYKKSSKIHWKPNLCYYPVHSLGYPSFIKNLCLFTGPWPIFYLILCQTFNESYDYHTLLEWCLVIKQLAYSINIQGIK